MDKFFLQSKTVIGILLTAFVGLAPMIGLNLTADDTALVSSVVDKALEVVGLVLAMYGRFVATQPLSIKPE